MSAQSSLESGWLSSTWVRVLFAAALLLAPATLLGLSARAQTSSPSGEEMRIVSLSNRADLLSGGEAYLEIFLPRANSARDLQVQLDGRNVTDNFAQRPNGRILGLVLGMTPGDHVVTATLPGARRAQLTLSNYPQGGPVFAGPQVQPWTCTTVSLGLGPPQDSQCNAPSTFSFAYRSTNPLRIGFLPYDVADPPADVATTVTDEGRRVPYIVRRERGTIDRGVYDISVLYDPREEWRPWATQPGWNRKLYVIFGGGCGQGYVQTSGADTLDKVALARGFAVAASGMNVLGDNCNDVVSAEALMMMKEHVVENYGEIRYTMSQGCSGGSMQQHWVAANYPGLIDGLVSCSSFPDVWETVQEAEDCALLNRVFDDRGSGTSWLDPADQAAVSGYGSVAPCRLWDPPGPSGGKARTMMDPSSTCFAGGATGSAPPEMRAYNPAVNPGGVRCTLQDYQVAQFGRRPDGFANRPFDNVGVQYGLVAVRAGTITTEQFVSLNERIGGWDIDWRWQTQRSQADADALRRAYSGGRVVEGDGLESVPIIDVRASANNDIHSDVHSHVLRERLVMANGHADNLVIWTTDRGSRGAFPFLLLDQWLASIEDDDSGRMLEEKIRLNKPPTAVDACWVAGRKVSTQSECARMFPYFAVPRIAAGGPLADDLLKCRLRPPMRSEYPLVMTDAQFTRLSAAFPKGVCDYSRPGVAQGPMTGPWQTYADGPDGRPLGRAR